MNKTFTENSRRIKELVPIKNYIESLGIKVGYGNRCDCPICRGRKGKMAINEAKGKVTCFGGCIRWGDIIDLHAILNNMNDIEALNDLIKIYSVNRVLPGSYKPIEEGELAFKTKAIEHIDKCLSELDKISLLNYELLEEIQCVDYCFYLKEVLDAKKQDLSYNKYNKDEIRHFYKKAMNFINKIKYIERNV